MDDLRNALEQLGVPLGTIPFVVIAIGVGLYFLKRHLDRHDTKRTEEREAARRYAAAQEKAMLEAYRMLYEQVNLTRLTDK